ncbi:hypothetical protein [Enterococcus sp. AZ126]|uniref:hypothetical protein n=1 Tax=Enterococcus sp. AZ126 TaxID=2774635 RepID=UPI003F296615
MKKVIYGVLLISVFGLTACGNNEKETSSSSKVEQLESRVKDLESSSSSDDKHIDRTKDEILSEIKSDANKKIVSAFIDNGLNVYNNGTVAVLETENTSNDIPEYSPVYTMNFAEQNNDPNLYFTISIFGSLEDLNSAYDLKSSEEYDYYLSKNDHINALMIGEAVKKSDETENIFNKYKKVFEQIQ